MHEIEDDGFCLNCEEPSEECRCERCHDCGEYEEHCSCCPSCGDPDCYFDCECQICGVMDIEADGLCAQCYHEEFGDDDE